MIAMSKGSLPSIATVAESCLVSRLRRLNRLVTNYYDAALRPVGLKASQFNILVLAAKYGVVRPAMISERLELEASTVSRNVERMRARGWLEVVPAEDARVQPFRLTAKGAALVEKALPAWEKAQRSARELLGDQGISLLDKATKNMRTAKRRPS
jgi:DNA-binding MarR family transcriptional regulator